MPERKLKLVSLDSIIQNQIKTQKIANKNVEFKTQIKPLKKIDISCDFNQMNRLFMNILKNSIESISKKKKRVFVSVFKKSKFVCIDVEDNGDGFPKNREKLFEPYITNKLNGTGLGLAICKKIIEDHNGEIELLDGALLGGALVRIKLYKKYIKSMSKLNDILIIDDEKDICEQISGLLNDKGYETKSTLTSEDGISAFKIKNYSLVILDIWLNNSKLDGFQTLEKLKR